MKNGGARWRSLCGGVGVQGESEAEPGGPFIEAVESIGAENTAAGIAAINDGGTKEGAAISESKSGVEDAQRKAAMARARGGAGRRRQRRRWLRPKKEVTWGKKGKGEGGDEEDQTRGLTVKAPGTETRTTFLPFHSSVFSLTATPVSTRDQCARLAHGIVGRW